MLHPVLQPQDIGRALPLSELLSSHPAARRNDVVRGRALAGPADYCCRTPRRPPEEEIRRSPLRGHCGARAPMRETFTTPPTKH
ncbi:hypothetical protein MRX96_005133 [Rhipicephalus microplus]